MKKAAIRAGTRGIKKKVRKVNLRSLKEEPFGLGLRLVRRDAAVQGLGLQAFE